MTYDDREKRLDSGLRVGVRLAAIAFVIAVVVAAADRATVTPTVPESRPASPSQTTRGTITPAGTYPQNPGERDAGAKARSEPKR